ncbi:hypothetical protein Plhal304r1_c013g0049741 [Plasmopara halstedii]
MISRILLRAAYSCCANLRYYSCINFIVPPVNGHIGVSIPNTVSHSRTVFWDVRSSGQCRTWTWSLGRLYSAAS